jgi:DNA-binding winged helix-turn-helix (wHTH) protein/TolB-like protein/Tfp pilus assembly protein PilF
MRVALNPRFPGPRPTQPGRPSPPLLIGEWQVYPALDELRREDRLVKLEPRLMRLLCVLAEQPGEVRSTEELLERAWPGVIVGPASIYQAIGQLRRVLGDAGEKPRYVATVSRKGYRLIAAVRPLVLPELPEAPAPDVDATARVAAAVPDAARDMTQPRARLRLAAGVAAVALGLGGWWAMRTTPEIVHVAVGAFADLSVDGSARTFASGLADELATGLARLPDLRVSATRAGRQAGPSDIDYVLEGSVRSLQGRVRISAQLVDARDGSLVWVNSYDRTQVAALAAQVEIASAIAESLRPALSSRSPARSVAAEPAVSAHDLYLLGRRQQLLRQGESIDRAIAYYQRAAEADPRFALAHAGIADATLFGLYYQARPLADLAPLVEQSVAKALELDSGLAEAYAVRGLLRAEQWRSDDAIADLRHALAINPALGEAHLRLGMANEYRGRPREALAAYNELLALDPLHTQVHTRRCLVLSKLARYAEASLACQRAQELQPELPNPFWVEGLMRYASGDTAGAIRAYERALERAPHRSDLRLALLWLYLDLGLLDAAAREVASARDNARPNDAGATVADLYVRLAAGDAGDVLKFLATADGIPAADLTDRLALARIAQLAGGNGLEVAREPGDSRARIPQNTYLLLEGHCEPCTLAALEGATSVTSAGAARASDPDAWLAALAEAGYAMPGLDYARAVRAAQRGDATAALGGLERAHAAGWRRAWLMRLEPAFADLRAEPRFRALLARVRRENAAMRTRLQREPERTPVFAARSAKPDAPGHD